MKLQDRQRDESRDHNKRQRENGISCTAFTVFITHTILIKIERGLETVGAAIIRKGLIVCFVSIVFLGLFCIGYMRVKTNDWPPGIFTCSGNTFSSRLENAAISFPRLDSWKLKVVFTNKEKRDVLDSGSDCMVAATRLRDIVVKNSSQFGSICADCNPSNLEDFQGLSADDIWTITGRGQNTTFTQELVQASDNLAFINLAVEKNSSYKVSAERAVLIFYLKNPRDKTIKKNYDNFEEALTSYVQDVQIRSKCRIERDQFKEEEEKVGLVVSPKTSYILYSVPILIFIGFIFALLFRFGILSITSFFLVTVNTAFCVIVAFGIFSIFLVPFHDSFIVVPFYVYSAALIQCLFLISSIETSIHFSSPRRRAGHCMTKAGFLITVTSFVVMLLTGVVAWSCIAAITNFFSLLFLTMFFIYITNFLIVMPVLFSLFPRPRRQRNSSAHSKRNTNACCAKLAYRSKIWINMVTSLPGKITLAISAALLLAGCIYIVVTGPSTIDSHAISSFYKDTGERAPLSDREDVSLILKGFDYENAELRKSLVDLGIRFRLKSYSVGPIRSWVASFEQWKSFERKNCNSSEFQTCLKSFLNNPITSSYESDIKTRNSAITESRLYFPVSTKSRELKNAMEDIITETSSLSGSIERVSSAFQAVEDVKLFQTGVLKAIFLAGAVVLVVLFLMTASLRTPIVLLLTFIMLTMELCALLYLFKVPLNQLTFMCTFPVVVFAFSWSVYVAQAFIISKIRSIKGKTVEAVSSTCGPLLTGAIFLLLCSVALGFGFNQLDTILQQVVPIFCIFGILHCFALMPAVLSTYGKMRKRLGLSKLHVPFTEQRRYTVIVRKANNATVIEQTQTPNERKTVSLIGIGCRFPLAPNKNEFWKMLQQGRCAVSSFPENRSNEYENFRSLYHPKRFVTGRICTLGGAYMDNIRGFDTAFFKISQQEANSMDPQQRILLEVVYEAIEDSGMTIEDLQACRTGVFVGVMNLDYGVLVTDKNNIKNMDQFVATGVTGSIVSNRISFCFNFTGPSFTVDTACSSSLTAFKLAIDNLQNGDCEAAIVCAPNLILSEIMHMTNSLAGLLAPDGRCKSFDASGDGYGRGEGFAAVVLKLTETALTDGDDIYSEVLACGLNNDGADTVPMTAPSSRSQAKLFRMVLERSGLQAKDVDYVEAHGTGTAIGDVVETTSISEAYCESIPHHSRVLRVGSVKSNLNHTESTSGLAGLIKLALMIKNQSYVSTINVHTLNPRLKLAEKGLMIQTVAERWERRDGKPRIGAVSSYGFGGSNAHTILREINSSSESSSLSSSQTAAHVLTLSARCKDSLRGAAQSIAKWLTEHEDLRLGLYDICYSLNERRTLHSHRIAISCETTDEVIKLLNDFAQDNKGWEKKVTYGVSREESQKLVFMFGGQGPQWYGMGKQLIENEPKFLKTILEVGKLLKEMGEGWDLVNELNASEENSRLQELVIGQTATFALQYAIARLLISWGIYPSAVIGHSLGEFAASVVAGALSLKDALSVVLLRAKLQERCPSNGAMAALGMSKEEAHSLLEELKLENTLSIAAVNDAKSVTLSGDRDSIEAFGDYMTVNGIKCFWKVLNTPRAFHSFHMALIEGTFLQEAARKRLAPKDTAIAFYSTVEGEVVAGKELGHQYWWRNIRQPVEFRKATTNLLRDGYREIVEIGAQPTLGHYVKQISTQEQLQDDDKPFVIPTLPRKSVIEQHKAFLQNTVCELFASGYPVQLNCVRSSSTHCKFIRLPNYVWQDKECWFRTKDPEKEVLPLDGTQSSYTQRPAHPFIGANVQTKPFTGLSCWTTEIDTFRLPYLKDHALTQGGAIMPGVTYLEMAFAMATQRFMCSSLELRDVKLLSLLTLPEGQVRSLRLRLVNDPSAADEAGYQITSVQEDQTELLLSSGRMRCVAEQKQTDDKSDNLETIGDSVKSLINQMKPFSVEEFHDLTKQFGFSYGPSFSVIKHIWKGESEGLCLIQLEETLSKEQHKYIIHPSILDACLQSCFVPISDVEISNKSIVPVGWDSVTVICSETPQQVLCHVKSDPEKWGHFDITQMTLSGKPIMKMKGFRIAELNVSGKAEEANLDSVCYNVTWQESDFPETKQDSLSETVCVVLEDSQGFADEFCKELRKQGAEIHTVEVPESNNFNTKDEEQKVRKVVEEAFRRSNEASKSLHVINFWPLQANILPESYNYIDQAQNVSLRSSLYVLKMLFDVDLSKAQLTMVTKATQYVSEKEKLDKGPIPWSSIVWGMRRTASLETKTMSVKAVDLSEMNTSGELTLLIKEVLSEDHEMEVAFRDGKRYVNRYVRLSAEDVTRDLASNKARKSDQSFYIVMKNKEDQRLELKAQTTAKILKGDVEVKMFNIFSPTEQIRDFANGSGYVAFSGSVQNVNSDSKRFKVNDKVCGIMRPRRVGSRVRVPELSLMLQPESLDDNKAATLPFCILTASKVLHRTLKNKQNSLVLIHEADNAIGYTTAAIATVIGHKVVCTTTHTGSDNIKSLLLGIGAVSIADASCLDLDAKYDGKFDVVLFMSLPRPGSLQYSYNGLKAKGKLVIACEGFSGQVILPGEKSISYDRINPSEILTEKKNLREEWNAIQSLLLTTGMLQKLSNVPQTAKCVLSAIHDWNDKMIPETPGVFKSFVFKQHEGLSLEIPGVDSFGLKGDRTYMVAGGVQGFGFVVARWMAENGANTIVLLGRSPPDEAKKQEVRELEERTGARIVILQIDLSSEEHMNALELKLRELPSVAGIVLTAMVLRDNLISLMELNSFRDVLAPKVKGAFLLHRMSLQMDLDFFVMFSSLSSVIGNTGQSAYSAGNAFQDSLAAYRRHVLGLPGLAINWGPIGGAGVMTREKKIVDLLSSAGFDMLDANKGAKLMGQIMCCQPSRCQVSLVEMRWAQHLKQNANLARSIRVESLKKEADTGDQQSGAVNSLASRILLERDTVKKSSMIEDFVYTTLAYWAGIDSFSEAEKTTSLYSFGVDSTAALTLKMSFEGTLDVSFEVFYFMQPDTTAVKIVRDITDILCEPADTPEPANQTEPGPVDKSGEAEESSHPSRPGRSFKYSHTRSKSVKIKSKNEANGVAHPSQSPVQVVPIYTPEKAEIKFFCVHPSHRYAMSLAPFATGFRYQELVSMYAIGFTEPTEQCHWDSVRQLAMEYTHLIREEQRHGPYFLGGYSFGGLVAYEMASILTEQNERVEFVCMIDTYAWLPASGGFGRLASWFSTGLTPEEQVELQFEAYLNKLAVKSLKMKEEECRSLRAEHSITRVIELLQQRSRDLDVPLYDLQTMWDSLMHDQVTASKTHDKWEPPEIQYEGPVTYLRSENPKFSPTLPQYKTSDKAWAEVLTGPMDVCICPGDHFSMGELPHARPVGMILANSISIRYRTLFPELYRFELDYKQRRAVRRFTEGVSVIRFSKKERSLSKPGKLFVDHENQELKFFRTEHLNKTTAGKIILLKDIRSVLPGKYVRNAIKQWMNKKKMKSGQVCDLRNVVAVFAADRTHNFEFAESAHAQMFVTMIEGLFNVKTMPF